MAENTTIASLTDVVSIREKQTKIVAGSKHSDAAQRLLAERYLRALAVFRFALTHHEDDPDALDDPVVSEIAEALSLDVEQLAAKDSDRGNGR